MMTKYERRIAEFLRDKLKKILPDLKLAYEDAKLLANKYEWDICCYDISEAYMNLAEQYIWIMAVLEEEGGAE